MTRFVLVLSLLISLPLHAREPQTVVPELDVELLAKFDGLLQNLSYTPQNFNLLIIGQDNSTSRRKLPDGRLTLGSRSDIVMVLSINTATKAMSILSLYRAHTPGSACEARMGRAAADKYINGVYSIQGRSGFIPCIEGLYQDLIEDAGPEFQSLLDHNGEFKINAFLEGTRSHTIAPFGKGVLEVITNNWWDFTWIYGAASLGAVIDVLWPGRIDEIQKAMNTETPPDIDDNDLDFEYLSVELKERMIYQAGGYQRAFNLATFIANALGWAAYGVQQRAGNDYEFIGHFFGDVINANFSRSIDFKALEDAVFQTPGDHLLRYACYRNNISPIRVIQWGESGSKFSVYENGEFRLVGGRNTLLKHLKPVAILPNPPSCN